MEGKICIEFRFSFVAWAGIVNPAGATFTNIDEEIPNTIITKANVKTLFIQKIIYYRSVRIKDQISNSR